MLSFLSQLIAGSPTGADADADTDADPTDANANADVRFRFPSQSAFPLSDKRQAISNQQPATSNQAAFPLCAGAPSRLALLYPTPPCAALPLLAALSVLHHTAPCAATAHYHQLTTMPMRCQTDHAPTALPIHPPARPLISPSTAASASASARLPSSASPRNPAPRLPAFTEPCQPDLLPHRRQRLTSKHDSQRLVNPSIHDEHRCLRRAAQAGAEETQR
jgi:hypothetical protein